MHEARVLLSAVCMLVAMGLCVHVGLRHTRLGALAVVLLAFAWSSLDAEWEGPILLVLVRDRSGIALADLPGLLAAVVGLALLVAGPRRSSRR